MDYTDTTVITRELLLVKVSILGPEYLEDQLLGGPSHDPRLGASDSSPNDTTDMEALEANFEGSGRPEDQQLQSDYSAPVPMTASEALRMKHRHSHAISVLAVQFGAKIVDVSENSVIVELAAKTSRVEAFLALVKPFGILEAARTGMLKALPWVFRVAEIFLQVSWPCRERQ